MEVREIFKLISKQLSIEFEKTKVSKHNPTIGGYREKALKDFLSEGKLPPKYALGSGEIVSPYFGYSKQADIIIYNRDDCPTLFYNEENSVYPIEGIYGVIEVKSKLSKDKLIEGLNNIATFKKMIKPNVVKKFGGNISFKASEPFGILFAYDLESNSLESLKKNFEEWGKDKERIESPNLIVILNKGIIYDSYSGELKTLRSIDTTLLKSQNFCPNILEFKEDTLFEFFKTLYDQLTTMELGSINLGLYEDKVRVTTSKKYYVKERTLIIGDGEKEYSYKESFLEDIIKNSKQKKFSEMLSESIEGNIQHSPEILKNDYNILFYDPENLPPLSIQELIKNGGAITKKTKGGWHTITINSVVYTVPLCYITEDVLVIK